VLTKNQAWDSVWQMLESMLNIWMKFWTKSHAFYNETVNLCKPHSAEKLATIFPRIKNLKCCYSRIETWARFWLLFLVLLRLVNPSGKCTKLHTVAASNNRDHEPQSLYHCLLHSMVTYICGVVLRRAHPVRGELHIQRNAIGKFATVQYSTM